MKTGEVLKIFRLINNKCCVDVALEVGRSACLVSSLEKGDREPSLNTIKLFAQCYKVDCGQIMRIQARSQTQKFSYLDTLRESLNEWLKINGCYINGEWRRAEQMRNVLKALRIANQLDRKEVKDKTSIDILYVETKACNISYDRLVKLSDIYGISASKILEIQEMSVKERWNYQRILLEVVKAIQN